MSSYGCSKLAGQLWQCDMEAVFLPHNTSVCTHMLVGRREGLRTVKGGVDEVPGATQSDQKSW